MPGELGNVVVAGHRTTYSKPFNRLNELQPGDPVVFTTAGGTLRLPGAGHRDRAGRGIDIAAQAYAHTATLFACHPPGSARQRIVAKLRLLGPDRPPGRRRRRAAPARCRARQAGDHTPRRPTRPTR